MPVYRVEAEKAIVESFVVIEYLISPKQQVVSSFEMLLSIIQSAEKTHRVSVVYKRGAPNQMDW